MTPDTSIDTPAAGSADRVSAGGVTGGNSQR